MSSTGESIANLKELAKEDLKASNEVQARIDQLWKDAQERKKPEIMELNLMGSDHKRIGAELVRRIEQIESQEKLSATDREMLQALTARLGAHDLQRARLAQFQHVQFDVRGEIPPEFLEVGYSSGHATLLTKGRRMSTNTQPTLHPWVGMDSTSASSPIPQQASTAAAADPRDIGASEYAMLKPHAAQVTNASEDEDEDEDEGSFYSRDEDEDRKEPEVDKSSWPLLYRIMDIGPGTPVYSFKNELKLRFKSLTLKHDPKHFPNDPSAPKRWTWCVKAYEILADPERKKFYDLHSNTPKNLGVVDLSKLSL